MTRAARTALLCGLILLLSAVAAQADKRVALVVGNSAYQHAPTLPNPVRDAQGMAKLFQNTGFDVVSALYDAGNLELKRAIRQFEDAAADSDIAVVYFAGHGIEIHGVNYLIPTDAKLASDRDADDEAITLDRLLASVDGARRLRLVILDACRENPFVPKMVQQRSAALRGVISGLAIVEPTTSNTLIAYAARAGAAAEDGQADHSPFTAALLNNLFVPGLDVRLAFGRVRDEVVKKTANKQEPFVYGSLGGANISLVPAPEQPPRAADLEGERDDYSRVEKIDTKRAWQIFLAQYPKGFYADLARENLAAIERAEQGRDEQARRTQAEQDRLAKEQAERDRLAAEQSEKDRLVKEQADKDRLAKEQAWNRVKDSNDPDQLRKFIEQFPNSAQRPVAEQQIALLAPAALKSPAMPAPDPHNLARLLQVELQRVGCFNGTVNGEFDDASKAAWHRFIQLTSIRMPDEISSDAINAVRGINKRVCPVVCPAGERAEGEQCVGNTPKRVTTDAAPSRPAPTPRVPAPAHRPSGKCFGFEGKQFCQ
jgi:uncharacterized caspase-like protein